VSNCPTLAKEHGLGLFIIDHKGNQNIDRIHALGKAFSGLAALCLESGKGFRIDIKSDDTVTLAHQIDRNATTHGAQANQSDDGML